MNWPENQVHEGRGAGTFEWGRNPAPFRWELTMRDTWEAEWAEEDDAVAVTLRANHVPEDVIQDVFRDKH